MGNTLRNVIKNVFVFALNAGIATGCIAPNFANAGSSSMPKDSTPRQTAPSTAPVPVCFDKNRGEWVVPTPNVVPSGIIDYALTGKNKPEYLDEQVPECGRNVIGARFKCSNNCPGPK